MSRTVFFFVFRFKSSFVCLLEENEPLPFRYDVQVNGRTNVYEHKALANSVDHLALRPTMFGLAFAGNFGKLPTVQAQLAWEVSWISLNILAYYRFRFTI